MEVRVPGVRKLRNMIERGNPLSAITQVTSQDTTTTILLKARIQHATQDGTMTKLGLLKSGKLMNRWNDRTVKPVVASWTRTHEFQSSFSHEKTKHVILEEEETHDRTGTPVVCPQEDQEHSNSSLETRKQNWICR